MMLRGGGGSRRVVVATARHSSRALATAAATNGSGKKHPSSPGRVVVVTSGKGGVGKTTVTASLGFGLAARGFRTCLIDFDIGLRNLDLHLVRVSYYIRERDFVCD